MGVLMDATFVKMMLGIALPAELDLNPHVSAGTEADVQRRFESWIHAFLSPTPSFNMI